MVAGLIGRWADVSRLTGRLSGSSPALEICFFALAAGAILFVVGQLWTAANRRISTDIILGALVLGYLAGLASDLVITYGGG